MYGTIARMHAKPGARDALVASMKDEPTDSDGFIGFQVYASEEDPDVLWMSVQFRDKASYQANADDPAQDGRYRKMREFLAEDPEWHDGEVISSAAAGAAV